MKTVKLFKNGCFLNERCQALRSLLFGLMVFVFMQLGFSQKPIIHHKIQSDSLLIRFDPGSANVWLSTINNGLRFVVKQGTNLLLDEVKTPVDASYISLHESETESDFLMVAGLIRIEAVPQPILESTFPVAEYTQVERDIARFDILQYTLNKNFDLTQFAGLGTIFKGFDQNKIYTIEVYLPGSTQPIITKSIDRANMVQASSPPMKVDWQNKAANISWETKTSKPTFYGYILTEQIGMGSELSLSEEPFVNLLDTAENINLHSLAIFQELISNDTTYTFSLYGLDYFGGKSTKPFVVKGQGREGIGLSPLITKYETLTTNEVDLEWMVLPKFEKYITSWRIYSSENYAGPYNLMTSDLPKSTRSAKEKIKNSSNFFRVVALDDQGQEVPSLPQLVMSFDTIPPAPPTNLKSEIFDSNMVSITWDRNREKDLYGYKVFYTIDTLSEWFLAHDTFLTAPFFIDSLALSSGYKEIYFKILASDQRNNLSDFSELLIVKMPDILRPFPPIFSNHIPDAGKVTLYWIPSPSEDVVKIDLLRSPDLKAGNWSLVKSFTPQTFVTSYVDSNLISEITYAYTLIAYDDVNLKSEPSPPLAINVLPKQYNLDPNDFKLELAGQKVKIVPQFADPNIYQIWVYKKIDKRAPSLHQIVDPSRNQTFAEDDLPAENEKVFYFLQVIFEDGSQTDYSKRKSISK